MAYSPTPIGETPGAVLRVSGCVYARDFPLIAGAGINTIRVYGRISAGERVLWQVLEKNDLYLLAGFPLDVYYDPRATLTANNEAGRALRARILADLREYAEQLRDSRRVIAIIFGNEVGNDYNRKFAGTPRDFYTLVEEAAGVLRSALGASAPLLTTGVADVSDIGLATAGARDSDLPGLSFWSVNVFRGATFGSLFDEIQRKTAKAALISEFGVDAWDELRQVEDGEPQAFALRSLTSELRQEVERPGATLVGGIWFGWSDEWWRGGPDPSRHGSGGQLVPFFPDRVSNPAWFGLFGITASDLPGLDSLRPRRAFDVLAEAWGGRLRPGWAPSIPPQLNSEGVVNAATLRGPVAPGGLLSLFGRELAAPPAQGLESPLPFEMNLTTACLSSRPVPLLAVDSGQINGQTPWETRVGSAPVLVYRAGAASNVVRVEVREFSPGILDRGVIQAGKSCPVTVANGVRPGAYLEIYGTGLGSAWSAPPSGAAPAVARPVDTAPRAFLGSQELRVLYSGLAPGIAGLYQTNTAVPPEYPPIPAVGLRLLAGGLESNTYWLRVLADSDRPRFTLRDEGLSLVVQAGGPAQTGALLVEGENGFCDVVRFEVTGLPEGVAVALPVAVPGQKVPVAVLATAQARGVQEVTATIRGISLVEEAPTARLRILVLPSRGDIPFRVISGGARHGSVARFEMAGRLLHEARGGGAGRGFNFIVLNGETGVLSPVQIFDTWMGEKASEQMADYLTALPLGSVVLGAIADEGSLHLTPRARAALLRVLSSGLIGQMRYQDSWAIISRVGALTPMAESLSGDGQVVLERVLTFPQPAP